MNKLFGASILSLLPTHTHRFDIDVNCWAETIGTRTADPTALMVDSALLDVVES